MVSIDQKLSKLFKYQRNHCPFLTKLIEVNNQETKVNYFNVKVSNYGFEGSIPVLTSVNDKVGLEMFYYIPDKEIVYESEKFLPSPFSIHWDCNFIYYGILTNCLAYMSCKKIKKISLVKMWDNEIINIKLKPMIAEHVISNLNLMKEQESKKEKEETLINNKQTSIFFTY